MKGKKREEGVKEFLGNSGLFLEKYFFLPLALYFAFDKACAVVRGHAYAAAVFQQILANKAAPADLKFISFFVSDFLLIFFNLTLMPSLIFRRNLTKKPDSFSEIIIPLLSILFLYLFNFLNMSIKNTVFLPLPLSWAPWSAFLGSLVTCVGIAFSFWALIVLRHSFAVFVEVRDVVTDGPYRYVRHPIYFGYLAQLLGLCLVYLSYIAVSLAIVTALFFWLRACLEEKKMAEASDAYRSYQKRTPFLFPVSFLRSQHGL